MSRQKSVGFLQYLKRNLGNELWVRVVGQELPWSRDACVPYYSSTVVVTTRVVIKINGHGDKRSSKFSNLNSVNIKSAETKQQNRLKQCFP